MLIISHIYFKLNLMIEDSEVLVAKNTRAVKEFTREQRLINENKQLKQELKHLRKLITRLENNGPENKQDFDQEEIDRFEENAGPVSSSLENLKKVWACKKCSNGYLEITLYSKLNQTFYYRACTNCDNRTKGQRYDSSSVKGIMTKSQRD
jgi:hypothetical protein